MSLQTARRGKIRLCVDLPQRFFVHRYAEGGAVIIKMFADAVVFQSAKACGSYHVRKRGVPVVRKSRMRVQVDAFHEVSIACFRLQGKRYRTRLAVI